MSTAVSEVRPPVARVHHWPITIAIWENESADGRIYYTFTIQRTCKDEKGQWQNASSFFSSHAQQLKMAIDDAWRWIEKRNQQLAEEGRAVDASGDISDAVVETEPAF